jgi:hypothetical protein
MRSDRSGPPCLANCLRSFRCLAPQQLRCPVADIGGCKRCFNRERTLCVTFWFDGGQRDGDFSFAWAVLRSSSSRARLVKWILDKLSQKSGAERAGVDWDSRGGLSFCLLEACCVPLYCRGFGRSVPGRLRDLKNWVAARSSISCSNILLSRRRERSLRLPYSFCPSLSIHPETECGSG